MQVDRHVESFGAFEHRPEELVVKVTPVGVAVGQCSHKTLVADDALELDHGSLQVAHRQGVEAEEPLGILRDRGRDSVVRLLGQVDRERRLEGLEEGGTLPDGRARPMAGKHLRLRGGADRRDGRGGDRRADGRKLVVLLETDHLCPAWRFSSLAMDFTYRSALERSATGLWMRTAVECSPGRS